MKALFFPLRRTVLLVFVVLVALAFQSYGMAAAQTDTAPPADWIENPTAGIVLEPVSEEAQP